MIAINKTHYFHITKEVIENKDCDATKENFVNYIEGIIKKEGATLTVDPGIPIDEVAGFFGIVAEALTANAKNALLLELMSHMPPAIAQTLKDLSKKFSIDIQKLSE